MRPTPGPDWSHQDCVPDPSSPSPRGRRWAGDARKAQQPHLKEPRSRLSHYHHAASLPTHQAHQAEVDALGTCCTWLLSWFTWWKEMGD